MSGNGDRAGHLLHNLMLFGRLLRELGLDVHSGRMIDAEGALRLVGVRRRQDFYHALRTVLVHRQQDLALFDEAFQTFWRPPKDDMTTMDLRSLGEERQVPAAAVRPAAHRRATRWAGMRAATPGTVSR